MTIKFEKVLERDIDLMLINSFSVNDGIAKYIKKQFDLEDYETVEICHSDTDVWGETDVLIILEKDNSRFGLLIEDKIDAVAQPNQAERYHKRAESGKENGRYSDYAIFIVAPEIYLNTNEEARKYPKAISYEELLSAADLQYQRALLTRALSEADSGYIPIEDRDVTAFWTAYYDMVDKHCGDKLTIKKIDGPRGRNAHWPELKTYYDKINIIHKSDKGYLDLTFPNMAEKMSEFISIVKPALDDSVLVVQTGKSMAIRKMVHKLDFRESFEEQCEDLIVCLKEAVELSRLLMRIDMTDLLKLSKNN